MTASAGFEGALLHAADTVSYFYLYLTRINVCTNASDDASTLLLQALVWDLSQCNLQRLSPRSRFLLVLAGHQLFCQRSVGCRVVREKRSSEQGFAQVASQTYASLDPER